MILVAINFIGTDHKTNPPIDLMWAELNICLFLMVVAIRREFRRIKIILFIGNRPDE